MQTITPSKVYKYKSEVILNYTYNKLHLKE